MHPHTRHTYTNTHTHTHTHTDALGKFLTTIAFDEDLKDQQEMFSNERNVTIMRLGEFVCVCELDVCTSSRHISFHVYSHTYTLLSHIGEKKVHQWFVDLADTCIPLLQMDWKGLKGIAAKHKDVKDGVNLYINEVVVPLCKHETTTGFRLKPKRADEQVCECVFTCLD
jgi:hypothetical protein